MTVMHRNDIRIRDPFVFLKEETYYLYGTTDENTWSGRGRGFQMFQSRDFNWFEGPIDVFKPDTDFWGKENYWAPEVCEYKKTYYMTASFKGDHGRGVQILQSDSLKGPFVPVENHPVTPEGWECLDGTLFMNGEEIYLIFCHEWTQTIDGEICIARLSKDMTYLETSPTILFKASQADWTVANHEYQKKGYVTDGPYIFSLKNGILAMIWSSYSKNGYSMGVSYSKQGIYGPWEHSSEPLYNKDGGHGMIFMDKSNRICLVIHSPNSWMEERVRLFEMEDLEGKLNIIGGIV